MSILQRGNDMWFGSESTRNFLTTKPDQKWLIPSINKKDEIMLSSHNWSKPTCMAYHCPACRKVIIDYSVKSE